MTPTILRLLLGVVMTAGVLAGGAAAQTVPGRVGTGGGNLGGVGAGVGGGGIGPSGAIGGSDLRLDRSLNSTLGGVGPAPTLDETIRAAVPVPPNAAAGQGSPPAPGQAAPDGGGSNCMCPDGRPADGNNQCLVYRDPQGVPASVTCQ